MRIFFLMILVASVPKPIFKAKNSEPSSLFLHVDWVFSVILLALFFLTACQPQADSEQQLVFSGPMMGTDYRITLRVNGSIAANDMKTLEIKVIDAMEAVNQSMSNYLSESELSRFNRLGAGEVQLLSPDFAEVMRESIAISELSAGAFDVTLAPAIDVWGFGPDGAITRKPSAEAIDELKSSVGYTKLSLNGRQLSKTVDGVELSLSAIAKGYAVDKVAAVLQQAGVNHFLINIGGELRALGESMDGATWKVGVEKPHVLGGIQTIASLDNHAIATSGDYRNYLLIDGQHFSHTIDPLTLSPIYHKLALVSVISSTTSRADALATAMLAMGEKRAWEFAQKHEIAAYLIIRGQKEGEYEVKLTDDFAANLQ